MLQITPGNLTMRLAGHEIRCVRGGREVFRELDFAVSAGEALAITGENGSGKTSLLRQIAGLLAMPAGKITLDGGDSELTVIEQSHYLAHRDPMKPALTVLENLQFWADFLGGVPTSPTDCIAAVGLSHATLLPAGFLSAGQRRRLSIARLLAVHRPIWLLDEPTAALDAGSMRMFAGLMCDHLARGGMIVAATHLPLGIDATELRIG